MNKFYVTTSRGLDDLLQQEIKTLCPDVTTRLTPGVVHVEGTLENAYFVCLWSRLANRVIWVLSEGKSDSADAVYDTAASVDWLQHFEPRNTISVNFVGTNRAIKNTQFGAVRIKDAIVDQFNEETGQRPTVDKRDADIAIQARCQRDKLILGIDLSGGSLHQRAYRQTTGEAPLKEHVACAMLMRSAWYHDQSLALVDPMCGSGTVAIEAAYISRNIAPGIKRPKWGFSHWKGHNPSVWDDLFNAALGAQTPAKGTIYASDLDRKLTAIASRNADNAGVYRDITFTTIDALKVTPQSEQPGVIISNPPYGERLGDLSGLIPLFSQWGEKLKSNWQGWKMGLLSSNRELLRVLKLRADKEYAVFNGKLDCKFVLYDLNEENCRVLGDSVQNHEFANRLKKNLKRLKPWLKKQDTNCYRIYDADLPDYNVAIDRYDDWLVVQEYAPPKDVPPEKAQRRLQEVLLHLPAVTGISPKQITLKVREQKKGKAQYEKVQSQGNRFSVYENGAQLLVNLTDYLDTGLFLDHRETRQLVKSMAKGKDVLNLFSYTGSVSVAAAKGGARSITTVDMSRTYLDWAKDNFKLNKLNGLFHFIQADCTSWLEQHREKYDLIFIDPPSFSNSKRMQTTWDVQRDHVDMLSNAHKCLKPGGTLIFSNNKRGFKIDETAMNELGFTVTNISKDTIPFDFERHSNIHQCWILQL